MTQRKAIVYSVLAIAAAAFWLHTHSDRAQVSRVFDSLENAIARESAETVMESAAKSQAFARRFTARCSISAPAYGVDSACSRENISGGMLAFRSGVKNIRVKFKNLAISIADLEANVEGVADLNGTDYSWPQKGGESIVFSAHLVKVDGKWLIDRIAVP